MQMTVHAEQRVQGRGIRQDDINVLMEYGDQRNKVGSGAVSVWLSRRKLKELKGDEIAPQQAERLEGLAAVIDRDSDTVITVMHMYGKRGRHYRRNFRRG